MFDKEVEDAIYKLRKTIVENLVKIYVGQEESKERVYLSKKLLELKVPYSTVLICIDLTEKEQKIVFTEDLINDREEMKRAPTILKSQIECFIKQGGDNEEIHCAKVINPYYNYVETEKEGEVK